MIENLVIAATLTLFTCAAPEKSGLSADPEEGNLILSAAMAARASDASANEAAAAGAEARKSGAATALVGHSGTPVGPSGGVAEKPGAKERARTGATGLLPASGGASETPRDGGVAGRSAWAGAAEGARGKAPDGSAGVPDGGATKADVGVKTADAGSRDGELAQPQPKPMTPEVKELVERMQAFYEKTQDFSASFEQVYTYKTFKRVSRSAGKVTYKRPALMRWEYETQDGKPSLRTFVLAGDRVYAYDPAAKLLTRAALSTNQLSASVTFLWGQGKLADEFSIATAACDQCAGTLLELTPVVKDPRFKLVRLEVDPKTAQVIRSIVVDPDGSENAIRFVGLVTNTGIDEKSFKLAPPPGTQVQDYLAKP
jgi:outer membrane lipoprotein carrier protein